MKLKSKNFFDKKPTFLVEENEIINDKPKDIDFINITYSPIKDPEAQAFESKKIGIENKINLKFKIPKNNPLSQIRKPFNKFDSFPQNTVVTK